jgi:hypothetical protein
MVVGALEVKRLSLWEVGALLGDPGGRVPLLGTLRMDRKGALGMGRLSLKRFTAEGSFTGDPGRYVKALDTSISLHRGPFTSKGNLKSGGGGSYIGDCE